ncbi:hypothetical protein FA13DRAFT_1750644 [Coprinellus micaceus]|uniref:Uncharacterized protein n=1 Tax=Coprinellus micaceus TaxID=71717 RepID=A0A4Y7R543_COPMI|nr:hypothetical protein FA13DRAFT_1750644 [Coprinellus micaceus]
MPPIPKPRPKPNPRRGISPSHAAEERQGLLYDAEAAKYKSKIGGVDDVPSSGSHVNGGASGSNVGVNSTSVEEYLRSNGTHDFKRTVLIVKQGLRAKSMKPIFPVRLHAESHGIVANNFWDPTLKEEFHYNQVKSCWKPEWWLGEPMWESAEKAGIITANLMWPGPPKTMSGASSTYFVPWRDKVPLDEKLEQIISWIDLPLGERPQLIMAYEPFTRPSWSRYGPTRRGKLLYTSTHSPRNLHNSLASRNLSSIVDIVFDGWPAMGLRFSATADASSYLQKLQKASEEGIKGGSDGRTGKKPVGKKRFSVYTAETMPERYHFSAKNSERIAPVYVVPEIDYVLTTRRRNHGYDNNEPSMHAMFVAHGPFSHDAKLTASTRLRRSASPLSEGWHSTSNDATSWTPSRTKWSAPNNGTSGFWDRYLE